MDYDEASKVKMRSTLEHIFSYYSTGAPGNMSRRMSSLRLQRLAVDAELQEPSVDAVAIDLVFKRICGTIDSMNFGQFLDALISIAALKYPSEPDQASLLNRIYRDKLSRFVPPPSLLPVDDVSQECLDVLRSCQKSLSQLYKCYFPFELNPNFKLKDSHARKGIMDLFEDYDVIPILLQKPAVLQAFRETLNASQLPDVFDETPNGLGRSFTFVHFSILLMVVSRKAFPSRAESEGLKLLALLSHMDRSNGRTRAKLRASAAVAVPTHLVTGKLRQMLVDSSQTDRLSPVSPSSKSHTQCFVDEQNEILRALFAYFGGGSPPVWTSESFHQFLRESGLVDLIDLGKVQHLLNTHSDSITFAHFQSTLWGAIVSDPSLFDTCVVELFRRLFTVTDEAPQTQFDMGASVISEPELTMTISFAERGIGRIFNLYCAQPGAVLFFADFKRFLSEFTLLPEAEDCMDRIFKQCQSPEHNALKLEGFRMSLVLLANACMPGQSLSDRLVRLLHRINSTTTAALLLGNFKGPLLPVRTSLPIKFPNPIILLATRRKMLLAPMIAAGAVINTDSLLAEQLDAADPVGHLRSEFILPQRNGKDAIYFVGNSLGPQPKACGEMVQKELSSWAERGVNGHFEGDAPWLHYDSFLVDQSAAIVGALPSEVAIMNSLTMNWHMLLIRFFNRATTNGFERRKILVESRPFPSDMYAIESQLRMRGFDPAECIVEMHPRKGEHLLRTEDILEKVAELGVELAVLAFAGVHFYTGQFFDIQTITNAVHNVGALAIWDLAHAAGNVDLQLHEWGVDGACWCTYKYLNGGPGGVGGFFIHEKHFGASLDVDRLLGWWSHDVKSRFQMNNQYSPSEGASEYRVSNVPILSSAALWSSLNVFGQTDMSTLRKKSIKLTAFLERLLLELRDASPEEFGFKIITSSNSLERGAQLSLLFDSNEKARALSVRLEELGAVIDYRPPGLLRVAPAPLFCSFTDVVRFRDIFAKATRELTGRAE